MEGGVAITISFRRDCVVFFFLSRVIKFETVCFVWLVNATRDHQHDNKFETLFFSPQAPQIKKVFVCACLFF